MRILIISDTHTDSIAKLPPIIAEEAAASDAVIHAGDVVSLNLLNGLRDINPNIYAVKGNMDPIADENILPLTRTLTLDNVRIGISHGTGSPSGIENRLLYTFPDCDIIIFGHTHRPFNGMVGGVWMLNPGSPTQKRFEKYPTYAVLTTDDGKFFAEIRRILP